ncbi:MAG TPA: MBL fold metallo-hydrolase [Candidatus Thermoplasmatota archaeon]|nr:MBL fold metallo-hydrolase [Candidatus Thermoplasmatota archaeon]
MKLTILGCDGAGVPTGSGHLVEHAGTRLVADLGNGVLGELARHADLDAVDGLFLTHLHADHVSDFPAFALLRRFRGARPFPVFGPPGTRALLERLVALFHADPAPYLAPFEVHELAAGFRARVGSLEVEAAPVAHNVPAFALRARPAAGGPLLVYTGDTRAGPEALEAARGADLLLAEATFQDPRPGAAAEPSRAHHMTAREAGALARGAAAKRLVLTHLTMLLDRSVSTREAREAFDGPVDVASAGRVFPL